MAWLEPAAGDLRAQIKTLPDGEGAASAILRSLASQDLDLDQLMAVGRAWTARPSLGEALAAGSRLRVLILGNYTTSYLAAAMVAGGLRHGLDLTVLEAPYDQIAQQALSPKSFTRTSGADIVLLLLDPRQLGLTNSMVDAEAARARAASALELLRSATDTLTRELGATIVVTTLPQTKAVLTGGADANHAGSLYAQIEWLNARLRELADRPSYALVDLDRLSATFGLADWHDARLWFSSKIPYGLAALPLIVEHVARVLGALRGKSRKALVLDLDNTLWGGVIGDDGLAGIKLANGSAAGEAFRAVQTYALEQRARGVVLAVCSKNEASTALSVFREHPDMLIREDDIAAYQINWDDKATNLTRIAKSLNLGLDALVFVDDNPAERLRVRQMLPGVAVPELPDDASAYADILNTASYFEVLRISDDDISRAAAYQANNARAAELESLGNMDAYLRSLVMEVSALPFDALGRTRISQLINKSNQFNMTTKRYSEAEIERIENDPNFFTLQVRLIDRFGDNGMISVVIFEKSKDIWICDTWLMSCRVLERRVEEMVLKIIVHAAKAAGAKALIGRYFPSKKNMIVADHFNKLGFQQIDNGDWPGSPQNGATRWRLDLATYVPPAIPIRVLTPEAHDALPKAT